MISPTPLGSLCIRRTTYCRSLELACLSDRKTFGTDSSWPDSVRRREKRTWNDRRRAPFCRCAHWIRQCGPVRDPKSGNCVWNTHLLYGLNVNYLTISFICDAVGNPDKFPVATWLRFKLCWSRIICWSDLSKFICLANTHLDEKLFCKSGLQATCLTLLSQSGAVQ